MWSLARSALPVFITIEGIEAGKHPLICRYMKGLYNTNPSLPKYSFTWDVGIVMTCLSGMPNNLKQGLSGKLAILFAILCGQTSKEILAVMDLRNICLNPLSANPTKWSNTLKASAFSEINPVPPYFFFT